MRLTLRTLLAYLDDILEPDDAHEMQRKIEDSEFATNLVHRMRNVVGRLRLGAPAVAGRGMGVDPNTVAEYLDNTLSAERIPEFEKFCLESDMHLAEVASCHQILTLLLGEPADVASESRAKMYGLINRADPPAEKPATGKAAGEAVGAAAQAATAATNGAAAAEIPAAAPRPKVEVPDYLRDIPSPWRIWKALAAVLLVALLLGVVVLAVQPELLPVEVATLLGMRGEVPAPAVNPPVGQPPVGHGNPDLAAANAAVGDVETINIDAADGRAAPEDDDAPIGDVEVVEVDDDSGETADAGQPVGGDVDQAAEAQVSDDDADDDGELSDVAEAMPDEDLPDSELASNDSPEGSVTPAKPTDDAPAAEVAIAPTVTIGRLLSNNGVLLRVDPRAQQWQRLRPQTTLSAGDRLISPPTFTSTIGLTDDVTVQVVGETDIKVDGPNGQGLLGIELAHGRLVLSTLGKAQTKVRATFGDRTGVLTFGDGGAALAVEVRPLPRDGVDPAAAPVIWQVDMYAVDGDLQWIDAASAEMVSLITPDHRTLGQPPADAALRAAPPAWYPTEPLSDIDKKASESVEQALREFNRSTVLGLQELAEDRRREVRSLAVRCLAAIGQYEPLIVALSDPDQRNAWNAQCDALREAVARGPATATAVQKALANKRIDRADALYRLLWGYSAEGLKSGYAARLVEYLDHPDLDFRVLAFWNLRNITGKGLFYRPEYPDAKRRSYVQKWQQQLASGQIAPRKEEPAAARPGAADTSDDEEPPQ